MPSEMIVANVTSSISSFSGSTAGLGWLITIVVFGGIFLALFLILKNFRRTVYGSIVSAVIFGVYKLSRYAGVSYQTGHSAPFKVIAFIIGFIIFSWIIGLFLDKTKTIKKFEKALAGIPYDDTQTKRNGGKNGTAKRSA